MYDPSKANPDSSREVENCYFYQNSGRTQLNAHSYCIAKLERVAKSLNHMKPNSVEKDGIIF